MEVWEVSLLGLRQFRLMLKRVYLSLSYLMISMKESKKL